MSLTRLAKTGLFQKIRLTGDEPEEIVKMVKLHRAVLDKALVDSFSVVDRVRNNVEYWLKLSNKDFVEACDRAMLEPELVYDTFYLMKEILKGQNATFKRFGKKAKPEQEPK
jgi:hypothetical protein